MLWQSASRAENIGIDLASRLRDGHNTPLSRLVVIAACNDVIR